MCKLRVGVGQAHCDALALADGQELPEPQSLLSARGRCGALPVLIPLCLPLALRAGVRGTLRPRARARA